MDNLCHTLVGAAFGEAGARKLTPLATATLLIGANLPDVDAATYFRDPVFALGFRRGWTHGVLAMVLLPLMLAALMLWFDRAVRRRRKPDAEPARAGPLLALAALAVWSHPLLDLLNTYGVRLLMPFSGRWFYGDTLFIVDPWILAALTLGIVLARALDRRGVARWTWPARIAIALCLGYIGSMWQTGRAAEFVVDAVMTQRGHRDIGVMVAPQPIDPFERAVVLELADGYLVGRWTFLARPRLHESWERIVGGVHGPGADEAAATSRGRTFLRWSRYPYYVRGGEAGCPLAHVCIRDARYPGQGWAEVAVPVGTPVSWMAPKNMELP